MTLRTKLGVAGLALPLVLVVSALYFWNATYQIVAEQRGWSEFALSGYKFRQITVLRWNAQVRGAFLEEKVIFGATDVIKVERVTWLDRDRAILLEIRTTYDSSPTESATPLLLDFTNGQLFTTMSGLATEQQVAEALRAIQERR